MDRPARRGRRARPLRPGARRDVHAGRDACRARPGSVPRSVSGRLHTGQRVVGLVRPRRRPVLGTPRRAAVGRLSHPQLDGRTTVRARLVARQTRDMAAPPSSPTPTLPPTASRTSSCHSEAGTRNSASTSSTSTTFGSRAIRMPPHSSSAARSSATHVPSATGTWASRPPPTAYRRRFASTEGSNPEPGPRAAG